MPEITWIIIFNFASNSLKSSYCGSFSLVKGASCNKWYVREFCEICNSRELCINIKTFREIVFYMWKIISSGIWMWTGKKTLQSSSGFINMLSLIHGFDFSVSGSGQSYNFSSLRSTLLWCIADECLTFYFTFCIW